MTTIGNGAAVSRRMFLKAMPAAPAALQSAAADVVQAQAAQGAMALAGMAPSAPAPYWGLGYLLENPSIWALHKAGMLPDWVRREVEFEISDRALRLSPDVVALRSVSLGAKYEIQRRRMERAMWSDLDARQASAMARRAFFDNQHPGRPAQ